MMKHMSKVLLTATVVASGIAMLGVPSASAAMWPGAVPAATQQAEAMPGVELATFRHRHYRNDGTFFFGLQDRDYAPNYYRHYRHYRHHRHGQFYSNSGYNYSTPYFEPRVGFSIGF